MTAEELWQRSGLSGEYEAWTFGEEQDKLAGLVVDGVKTATSSAYAVYLAENEPVPEAGSYSVILDSKNEAVCIVRTTKVEIVPYRQVTEEFARKEGEGDRSLEYWRSVHEDFFTRELQAVKMRFTDEILVVCEEFELVMTS